MAFKPDPKPEKREKKKPKPLKRTAIKQKFKPTGEKHAFEEVLDEISYDGPTTCFVCGWQISIVTHNNFAHILAKGKYPTLRLYPPNIKIMCHHIIAVNRGNGIPTNGCHSDWDTKPKSTLTDPMWDKVFELEEELKQLLKDGEI
jgi:hypothetical protein